MSRITTGWLARHTPQGTGGRQAALIDIAQDLLLTRLCQHGIFDHLVFKGGTALRKLYAGNAGRFSTGFRYFVENHRGRAQVRYETPFGGVGNLTTKLDIGPAPWLPPDERGWVRLPVHAAYDLPPALPVMSLAENMAEKVARLTRRTPARDVYDLAWISSTSPHSGFDRPLVRRLAVLKNWVDQHGLSSPPAAWRPVTGAIPYDPGRWQMTRRAADFDEDSIGILAVPPPSLDALGDQLRTHFGFLADLDGAERRIIAGGAGSRNLVLEAISSLPGARLANRPLY
jgi:uncharacterized protein